MTDRHGAALTALRRTPWIATLILFTACSNSAVNEASTDDAPPVVTRPADVAPVTTLAATTTTSAVSTTTTVPATSTSTTTTTTTATTVPETSSSTSTTITLPTTTPYVVPVADVGRTGWSDTHAGYPATDLFLPCGADIVSAVNGTVTEVRRVNAYDPAVDNPATRGGLSITTIGDDGVRYYYAHFEDIAPEVAVGARVQVGQYLGSMGTTGRSSACHLHFAISPPCPGPEWSVRRGAVWPYPYLADWRRGEQTSPAPEVAEWARANPDACAEAMADPFAADG